MSFSYSIITKNLASVSAALAEARAQAYPGASTTDDVGYVLSDAATSQCVRAEAVAQSFAANEPLDVGVESLYVSISGHTPGRVSGFLDVRFSHVADEAPTEDTAQSSAG